MFLEFKVWLGWEMVSYFFMSKFLRKGSYTFLVPGHTVQLYFRFLFPLLFFSQVASEGTFEELSHCLFCLGLRTVYRMDVQVKIH